MIKKISKFKDLLIILLISIISLYLGYLNDKIGSGVFAIVIGIIVTQFIKKKDNKQVNITLKKSLNTTIILLGFTINFNIILTLGLKSLILIILSIVITIISFYYLAKYLKFSKEFSLLFAIGNAICGSSAIMSANNYLKAKKNDFNLSVSVVNIMGVILMFSFPIIFSLIKHSTVQNGFIIGSTIQSVAQVLGAAQIAGKEYINVATLVKMTRVFMLIFVLISLGFWTSKNQSKKQKIKINIKQILPMFLILFIIAIIITNVIKIPDPILFYIKQSAHVLETIALVCIGYQIMFKDLLKQIKKIFLLVVSSLTIQIILAQVLILFI